MIIWIDLMPWQWTQLRNISTGVTQSNGEPILAVAFYSADVQQSQEDGCTNRSCTDICVNSVSGSVCLCREGYKLSGDGMTCTVSSACSTNSGRGRCSTFCLPTHSGYTCGCEDGVDLLSDQRTFGNDSTYAVILDLDAPEKPTETSSKDVDKTMFGNILFFLIMLTCTWTLHAQIDGTQYEDSILVSSMTSSISSTRNKHINLLPGTLYNVKNITSVHTLGLSDFNTRLLSLEADYARHRVYMFDFNTASIYVLNNFNWEQSFAGLTRSVIHNGVSRHSVRLAFDWISNNIYWTDPLFGWIVVQSIGNTNAYKILLKDDLDRPVALAVDPINKYIFWSDTGSTKKIERALLTGDGRKTIISTGLGYPASIDIDQVANKLIWVDSERDTLETANFDGTGRRLIRRMSHTSFYDVAAYRNVVGVTDMNDGSFNVFNKTTGALISSKTKTNGDPFLAVALYSADVQPSQADRCTNRGCSDICVNSISGPVCLCREGYELNGDGLTCTEALGGFHRALMWCNSSSICMMDIRSLTSSGYTSSANCFFTGGSKITKFDIDMAERKVIFVDGTEIYSINIDQNSAKQRLLSAIEEITGFAIDWRDDNIYWCKGGSTGNINLFSQSTLQEITLVDTNLTYPRHLNVIPSHNIMVWTSGTSGAYMIEQSDLKGLNRDVLVSSLFLLNPNGLTVDFSTTTLYFIDSADIKTFDIESKKLTTLSPTSVYFAPKFVLTYKNYLAVADSSLFDRDIKIYEKQSKPILRLRISTINVTTMTAMKVLDASLQSSVPGPCNILNGDCEQICIPTESNRACLCEYGFQLDSNNKTCSSNLYSDNFLLVTDWTHNKISQISLVDDDIRAIDTDTYGSPIGIVYNQETNQIIWSTNEAVHVIFLNGTGYKLILNTEMLSCYAERLVIAYSNGNIYYTAINTTSSGFFGVGILSPEGLHKRLIEYGEKPRDIALDPEEGLLFWTDYGFSPSFVKKAYMDGSNIMTVMQTGLTWPNGLAIDTQANVLYIIDGKTDIIHRCTYNGACVNYYTDSEALLMDIEMLGDYLYFTSWNKPYVTKLHKTYPSLVSRIGYNSELGRLHSLSGYSSTLSLPSVSSACSTNVGRGRCSTFCLPTPSGYTCGCEDGVDLLSDQRTCENALTTTVFTKTTTTSKSTSLTKITPTTTTTPTATFTISTSTKFMTPPTTTNSQVATTVSTEATTSTKTATAKEGTGILAIRTTPHTSETSTHNFISAKATEIPSAAIAGVVAGFVVLVLIIVVLVVVLLKRKKVIIKQNSRHVSALWVNNSSSVDLALADRESHRPDSTYAVILDSDAPEKPTETSSKDVDNNHYDLATETDHEVVEVDVKDDVYNSLKVHAMPNEYRTLANVSPTSNRESDDGYAIPVTRVMHPTARTDF